MKARSNSNPRAVRRRRLRVRVNAWRTVDPIPRTPWGDPDIQGTYTNSNESGIPMERPAEFAGRRLEDVKPEELAQLIKQRAARDEQTAEVDRRHAGREHRRRTEALVRELPGDEQPRLDDLRSSRLQDAGDHRRAKRRAAAVRAARRGGDGYYTGPFDGPEDLTLYVRCITRGVPGSMMPAIYGNSYEIVQSPGVVAIRYEMVHETRVIPLDGRKTLPAHMQSHMGDSRGHWEGDTLVVEGQPLPREVGVRRRLEPAQDD